jgi:hypothetical protein
MWALAWLRPSENADDFAVTVDFHNAPCYGVSHIKEVVWAERKAIRIAELSLPQEAPIGVKDLDAGVLAVADVHQIAVNHDGVRSIELSWPGALHSPAKQFIAVLVEFQHATSAGCSKCSRPCVVVRRSVGSRC